MGWSAPVPPPSYGYTNLTQLDHYVPYSGPFLDPQGAKLYIDSTYANVRHVFAVDPGSLYCKADVVPYYKSDFLESSPPTNFVGLPPRATPHEFPQCDAVRPSDGWCTHASCLPVSASMQGTYQMYATCPATARFRTGGYCDCPPEQTWSIAAGSCTPYRDRYHDRPSQTCDAVGNPISLLTGVKTQEEVLTAAWPGSPFRVAATYSNRPAVPDSDASTPPPPSPASFFGPWATTLHKQIIYQTFNGGEPWAVQVARGFGYWSSFERDTSASTYHTDAGGRDRLVRNGYTWRYYDAGSNALETYSFQFYDSVGKLLTVASSAGQTLSYGYSDASTPPAVAPVSGLLISVSDGFGRAIQFLYEAPGGAPPRIFKIIDSAGQAIDVGYLDGNLSTLTWADGAVRRFLYENVGFPWALTGVIDENSKRMSTYTYDSSGRAVQTELAGGVQRFTVSNASPPRWNTVETYDASQHIVWRDHYWQLASGTSVATPSGSSKTLGSVLTLGGPRIASQNQPAGSGCAASTSLLTYDVNGNVASEDDFNGNRVCRSSDLSRNLETARVEGLANTAVCSTVTAVGATLPAGSRKASTQWHPDWRIEAKRAEPLKLTTSVYNGQPDPFSGGAIASCAPAGAVLPDGKPIVVLCKQVEQATSDANGALGFSAALQAGVPNRQQSWSYNQYGQVLTATDPLGHTTSYAYYASTGADYTMGDLQQVTNALGQVTSYPKYNKSGQVLRTVEPNGVVTDNTYDLRQRLTSSTVGGQQTVYTYDPAGQLIQLTLPDTTRITYTWDDAHRLTKVTDQAGNSVTYTLDNAGNRTAEQIKDPSGTLARTVTRVFDALNRIQQMTGGCDE